MNRVFVGSSARDRQRGLTVREIVDFAPGEFKKLDKLLGSIWQKWIADREAKGLPARKVLNDLYKMMSEVGQKNPIAEYSP